MTAIAEILQNCGEIPLEIQGHTDSQGRNSMNLELSEARAQSVLDYLRSRRMLTGSYTARGYGEESPIASNSTEDGREANRRIEFRLIRPEPTVERTSTLDSMAQEGDTAEDADEPEGTDSE